MFILHIRWPQSIENSKRAYRETNRGFINDFTFHIPQYLDVMKFNNNLFRKSCCYLCVFRFVSCDTFGCLVFSYFNFVVEKYFCKNVENCFFRMESRTDYKIRNIDYWERASMVFLCLVLNWGVYSSWKSLKLEFSKISWNCCKYSWNLADFKILANLEFFLNA